MIGRRVALLRGINVGNAKRIAMADLRKLFETLGYGDVRTLPNSGNVVFTVVKEGAANDSARIEKAIEDRLGVTMRVTVLLGRDVAEAVHENPLGAVADNPSHLLLMALQFGVDSLVTISAGCPFLAGELRSVVVAGGTWI